MPVSCGRARVLPEGHSCPPRVTRTHGEPARVRARRRACVAFPPRAGQQVGGAGRVCFRESFPGQSSWRIAQELLRKFTPCEAEIVPGENGLKSCGVHGTRLDELEQ